MNFNTFFIRGLNINYRFTIIITLFSTNYSSSVNASVSTNGYHFDIPYIGDRYARKLREFDWQNSRNGSIRLFAQVLRLKFPKIK